MSSSYAAHTNEHLELGQQTRDAAAGVRNSSILTAFCVLLERADFALRTGATGLRRDRLR
ncbi:hypothetical protein ACFRAU_14200 [Arthrobacter sp. NPDC056691]|uniref:hypothetical protein n=1 Tax=Arthrobacter sp. NPDC056691 TaxID=3345913 RepID=UPI00366E42E8